MEIRDASEADLPEILAIRNDVIATTTAIWTEEPATLEDVRGWFTSRTADGNPVIVAARGGEVLGFGSFGPFRAWPGYRFTAEHSVHVRADARGEGVGRALVTELIARARAAGKHVLIAGVDTEGTASLGLHESLGFERVAWFREIGWKFGRRLDLVFLQLILD